MFPVLTIHLLIVWFIFVLECIQGKLQGLVSADIRQILIETHGLPSPDSGNEWYTHQ
jgi:hypothetical protein